MYEYMYEYMLLWSSSLVGHGSEMSHWRINPIPQHLIATPSPSSHDKNMMTHQSRPLYPLSH